MRFTRKLEIGHWNQGKGYKGSRKAELRAHLESEIDTQIAEQDENYRTRHKARHPNKEAQLKGRIEWYEQRAKCFHYSNLQPLWARENMEKSNHVPVWS